MAHCACVCPSSVYNRRRNLDGRCSPAARNWQYLALRSKADNQGSATGAYQTTTEYTKHAFGTHKRRSTCTGEQAHHDFKRAMRRSQGPGHVRRPSGTTLCGMRCCCCRTGKQKRTTTARSNPYFGAHMFTKGGFNFAAMRYLSSWCAHGMVRMTKLCVHRCIPDAQAHYLLWLPYATNPL